jgi:hypothetical protein
MVRQVMYGGERSMLGSQFVSLTPSNGGEPVPCRIKNLLDGGDGWGIDLRLAPGTKANRSASLHPPSS